MSKRHRLVAFTGAGISKQSGIPTFEELNNRDLLHRKVCVNEPQLFYSNLLTMYHNCQNAKPNEAHNALANAHIPLITMNVDGLHKKAGSTNVIEIHGNMERVHCTHCHNSYPFSEIENRIRCATCGHVYEHDVVLYGDAMPLLEQAMQLVEQTEELLVVGTSFYTSTAGFLVDHAKWFNATVTVLNEDAAHTVPAYLHNVLTK